MKFQRVLRAIGASGPAPLILILLVAAPHIAVNAPAAVAHRSKADELMELRGKLVGAAGRGELEEVKRLLEQGAALDRPDQRGLTPWQAARIHGQQEVADYLRSHGARPRMPAKLERVVDASLKQIVQDNAPGVAVLVARNGSVLLERGYGLANVEHHVPVTPETKFRIGSITKQFTASAILKLQEEGKLRLDDTLSKYFPDFPRGNEVRLHHLLTHTSGIHSYTSKPNFLQTATVFSKPEDLIASFQNDPFDFSPGQRWAYNNSGYFLLGSIIEKVSGESYDDFLREHFFAPFRMTHTGVHHASDVLPHEAQGYAWDGGKLKKALSWDMSRAGGAGALYSTVGDLYRWTEAIFNDQVLSDASREAAFTPVKTTENPAPSEEGYGFGWGIGKLRELRQISHGGGLNGFQSYLLRMPDEKLTVVVLANASPTAPGLDPGPLANEIAQLYLAEKLAWRPSLVANQAISSDAFDACAGRYDYGGPILTVSREGAHLFAQLTGQPKFEIYPKTETEFFWKATEARIVFVKDDKGAVIKAIHRQSGQTIQAPRLPDEKVVAVDAAKLDACVGEYEYGGGQAIMTITHEGDGLFAQLTGQPKFQIFPKSDSEFFWKAIEARITFVKNEEGKVIKAIHEQSGKKFDAQKLK